MKIKKLDIDSKVLGRKAYQIEEIEDGKAFLEEEPSLILKYNPFYIQFLADASDLSTIHSMEDVGFRFAEFRFKKLLDIHSFHTISESAFYPYIIQPVMEDAEYQKAQHLVKESRPDDRFSLDPLIPEELSQNRLQYYLQKSFDNYPKEFIYGLFNKTTNELLAVKSGRQSKEEITFFHTALKKDVDREKYTYMLDALLISQFIKEGVHLFYSISSGFNLMEMDLHLTDLKYKMVSATVILRKIYQ